MRVFPSNFTFLRFPRVVFLIYVGVDFDDTPRFNKEKIFYYL